MAQNYNEPLFLWVSDPEFPAHCLSKYKNRTCVVAFICKLSYVLPLSGSCTLHTEPNLLYCAQRELQVTKLTFTLLCLELGKECDSCTFSFHLFQQRVEIHKLRQGENLILGFSIGGGIDQDPAQNPFSEDKTDKGIYVTRVTEGGPAEVAGLQVGDKIMQVNGWDMTMVTHDQARKRLTKRNEEVVRLLVTRHSLQKAVQQSMMS
nr:tax1-binding protein 3 [Pelodiscus sinensis]|eukprot:XP_006138804.1 tax1-binding protein 3 [Pelodiscus sinensis]